MGIYLINISRQLGDTECSVDGIVESLRSKMVALSENHF